MNNDAPRETSKSFRFVCKYVNSITPTNKHLDTGIEMQNGGSLFHKNKTSTGSRSRSSSKEHLNPGIEMYNGHRFPLVRKYGDPVTPSSEHCNPRMEMHNGGFVFPYKHFLHRLPLVRKYGNLGTPSKTHFSLRIELHNGIPLFHRHGFHGRPLVRNTLIQSRRPTHISVLGLRCIWNFRLPIETEPPWVSACPQLR